MKPVNRMYLALLGLAAVACSEDSASQQATPAASTVAPTSPAKATYRLLDVTKNESLSKLNADVLLSGKMDTSQVRELGLHLRDSLSGYQKNYFFFYLPGMKVGSGAWATAHFNPDAEIRLLGATQAEEDSSKSKLRVPGKLIGKWYEEQRTASALAFYEQGGQCFLTQVYRGGKPSTTLFVRHGNVFKQKEDSGLGEYFKIQPDGTLGFVNDEGKVFGQALPIR